jgi:hypothetical protein
MAAQGATKISCLALCGSLAGKSQKEVSCCQALHVGKPDETFSLQISVRIDQDASLRPDNLVPDLTCPREFAFTDESEGLVATEETVGIQPRKIQTVMSIMAEVPHYVRSIEGSTDCT